jgi:hypothetical protein
VKSFNQVAFLCPYKSGEQNCPWCCGEQLCLAGSSKGQQTLYSCFREGQRTLHSHNAWFCVLLSVPDVMPGRFRVSKGGQPNLCQRHLELYLEETSIKLLIGCLTEASGQLQDTSPLVPDMLMILYGWLDAWGPGLVGTHHTLEVAQTLRVHLEGWFPRGCWHWLWTDKDTQDWGLLWRGKCPRSKLQTAARPGNLVHSIQGKEERQSQRDIVSKMFSKQRKENGHTQFKEELSLCQILKASWPPMMGLGPVSQMTEYMFIEGLGRSRLMDSVPSQVHKCESE